MVVKPLDFICKGKHRLVQPAVKCRGPEYLRIIYGPEYLLPENLERLRARGVGAKRSLASREFALGIESLERFNRRESHAGTLSWSRAENRFMSGWQVRLESQFRTAPCPDAGTLSGTDSPAAFDSRTSFSQKSDIVIHYQETMSTKTAL